MTEVLQNYLEDEVAKGETWNNLSDNELTREINQRVEQLLNQPEVLPSAQYFKELLPTLRVRYIAGFDKETAHQNLDQAVDDSYNEHTRLNEQLKECEEILTNAENMARTLKTSAGDEARRKFYGTRDGKSVAEVEEEIKDLVEAAKRYRDLRLELFKNSVWNKCINRLRKEIDQR